MNFKFSFLISIVIALSAGYIDNIGYFLGVSRTIYFFPFFILGHKFCLSFLSNVILIKKSIFICFSVLLLTFLFFLFLDGLSPSWLYGSMSYERLGNTEWYSFLIRLLFYFISFSSSVAILILMLNRHPILSTHSQNTLFVYVWHGFFVKMAMCLGIIKFLNNACDLFALLFLFIFSVLITFLLSSGFVANLTNKFFLGPAQNFFLVKS